jgi:hypothetical protein
MGSMALIFGCGFVDAGGEMLMVGRSMSVKMLDGLPFFLPGGLPGNGPV